MTESHESLSDRQTAIRVATVIGCLTVVILLVVAVAGLLA